MCRFLRVFRPSFSSLRPWLEALLANVEIGMPLPAQVQFSLLPKTLKTSLTNETKEANLARWKITRFLSFVSFLYFISKYFFTFGPWCSIVRFVSSLLFNSTFWYFVVSHGTYISVYPGTAMYFMVLHGSSWYFMLLHGTSWYPVVLHCTLWYNTSWFLVVLYGISWHVIIILHYP